MNALAVALRLKGYAHVPNALPGAELLADVILPGGAVGGSRCLLDQPWCVELAQALRAHALIGPLLPCDAVAVQCTYFEKSSSRNWLVPVHQDLSIPVAARVVARGWRGWSTKEGSLFGQPPVEVLESMVALRVHLDPCGVEDGALRFVPGSHCLGVIDAAAAVRERDRVGEQIGTASPGDVIAMKPLVLHASSKSRGFSRRRVLHFLFGPSQLPDGAAWARRI
ncbi:MAG TPA: phytanoyl-CoA dioxygenase family protein [Roseateles sp.]